MSSSGITFSGLASGLDSQAIIQGLLSLERRPLIALEDKKDLYKKQKGLFGDLDDKLDALAKAADAIKLSTEFLDFKAAVDRDDFFSASANNNAVAGTYEISVESLAASEVRRADPVADKDAGLGNASGVLLFDINGETQAVNVGTDASLQDIANAINGAGIDVQAQVIDTGSSSGTPFELVVTSRIAGEDGQFTVTSDLTGGPLETLANEINANEVIAGTNAQIRLNGIDISRSTNSISDVIAGVTLELTGAEPGTTTRLTVSPDGAATAEKVKEFVDAYNEIVDFLDAQAVVSEDGEAESSLFGDVTLRSVRSSLRGILGGSVSTGNDAYSLLSQVGIDADRQGRLTFNQGEFEEAVTDDEDAVRTLFTEATNGIAGRISNQVDVYTDSVDGLIKARRDGFDRLTRQADRSIERMELRLERMEQQLTAQFANLEVLINNLNGQGGALSAIGAPPPSL